MSYFSHLYRCRLGARKRNGWKPLVEKYGELKAIIFEKLYKESNEWDDLRNITQNTLEARRKQNMAKLIKKIRKKNGS